MDQKAIQRDAEIMGGVPIFVGTRVPFSFLFDYLKSGESLETFLSDYPTVSKELSIAALKMAEQAAVKYLDCTG